jgi:hypothetical protein
MNILVQSGDVPGPNTYIPSLAVHSCGDAGGAGMQGAARVLNLDCDWRLCNLYLPAET